MTCTPPSTGAPDVVLVFPPLVESNLGQIYPSTAVLAAFLEQRGHRTRQVDLNHRFVQQLIGTDELTELAAHPAAPAMTAAAARWLRRGVAAGTVGFRDVLDAEGTPLLHVLRCLLDPLSISPDRRVLENLTVDPFADEVFDRFARREATALVGGDSTATLIGISVAMGPQLLPALHLARACRDTRPDSDCRIVMGGPAISLLADHDVARLLRRHPALDAVVRFDGELPLAALVEQLSVGEWRPHDVPGTSSVDACGGRTRVVHAAPAAGPRLRDLPTPQYDSAMLDAAGTPTLAVTQARGCYWGKCDYCDFVEVYQGSPSYRGRPAEQVVDDIERLVASTGVRRFRVVTESIPPAFAARFARELVDRELDVSWSSFAMVDRRFDAELLGLLGRSGCDHLVVGMESMVTRVLRLVHKSADRTENIRFLEEAAAAGIRLTVNLIPNLPTTTRTEALESLADVERLSHCIDRINIFEFEPTRSSNIGRRASSFGLVVTDQASLGGQAQLALNTLPCHDPAMTTAEQREVVARYRAFASSLARRNPAPATDPREYVDVADVSRGDGTSVRIVTDFVTRQQFRLDGTPQQAARRQSSISS